MHISRRTAVALAVAVAFGGAATVSQTATAAPKSAWAATATKGVTFTGPRLGNLASARYLHLQIALAPRNQAAMTSELHALYRPGSSTYHHFLTPTQWNARYAPTAESVAKVASYLRAQGLTGIGVASNRMLISATATTAQAQRAFHTTLANFKLGENVVFGNVTPALVPAALSSVVTAVVGLNDLPLMSVGAKTTGSPDIEGGLTPKQFQTTYDAKDTRTGKRIKIAILSQGSPKPVVHSLRIAERKEKEKRVPVTIRRIGPQQKDTSGADEFDMDSQVSTGVAGSVKHLYLYNIGALLDQEIDASFNDFIAEDKAIALSASIGGCEVNAYVDGSETIVDIAEQQGAMQGQTIFASSGDNGDACMYVAAIGAPAGVPGVNWPASGAFTTAVGGTSLVTDDKGRRIKELAWAGSGGGVSYVENPGWWTAATDPAYDAEFVTGGRAVPDISLDADPNVATPAIVYVGKTKNYVGGTSLSSPMMLGFWARLEAKHHNRLGLASIALYNVYDHINPGTTKKAEGVPVTVPAANPKPVPGLTDIVLGTNGVFPAIPGYDEATGLGAPDVKVLAKVIGKKHR